MDLSMYLLLIMAHIMALPLDEIFKVIIPHMAIQYLFDFILLIAIDSHRWWGRVMSSAWNGVWEH
jgi:hypothetical protein